MFHFAAVSAPGDGLGVGFGVGVGVGAGGVAPRLALAVTCDQCGIEWTRGDPDSSASHRRQHKHRMKYLDPQPVARVLEERSADIWSEEVTAASPLWRHDEMYNRAYAFKREQRYDFVQWDNPERDHAAKGYLFADADGRIIGCCAFRFREYTNHQPGWALQFVWVAPPYRRSGVLAERWPAFRDRFGDFLVEGPVSTPMQAFLRRVGDERLMFGSDAAYAEFLASRPV